MNDLIVAIGLVLVLEGVVYALFPGAMRNMVNEMAKLPVQTCVTLNPGALCLGVFVVWLIRG